MKPKKIIWLLHNLLRFSAIPETYFKLMVVEDFLIGTKPSPSFKKFPRIFFKKNNSKLNDWSLTMLAFMAVLLLLLQLILFLTELTVRYFRTISLIGILLLKLFKLRSFGLNMSEIITGIKAILLK